MTVIHDAAIARRFFFFFFILPGRCTRWEEREKNGLFIWQKVSNVFVDFDGDIRRFICRRVFGGF